MGATPASGGGAGRGAGAGAGLGANTTLLPYAVCGLSPSNLTTKYGGLGIVPINKTCPPLMSFYGDATVPFETVAGCPAQSTTSLADVTVPQGQISVPALAGEAAPSPGESACFAVSKSGDRLTYDQCT